MTPDEVILLSHGAGGKLTARLIDSVFLPRYGNEILRRLGDGAVLPPLAGDPVLTTDAYVVSPRFFPGGDIGSLAVHGTVNDLLMCGAEPRWLSLAFVLEEGFPCEELARICDSIGRAAAGAGVLVVTGDTKVVERGRGDGIYIAAAGVGERVRGLELDPRRARPGDAILLSGPVGQHGVAVLGARRGLAFTTPVISDSRALLREARALFAFGGALRTMHDPTRGGLATCLNEIARAAGARIAIDEDAVPRDPPVEQACELLGMDPLYMANEGKLVAVAAPEAAPAMCAALRAAGAAEAACIGAVVEGSPLVAAASSAGGERILDVLTGDPLPRIC